MILWQVVHIVMILEDTFPVKCFAAETGGKESHVRLSSTPTTIYTSWPVLACERIEGLFSLPLNPHLPSLFPLN